MFRVTLTSEIVARPDEFDGQRLFKLLPFEYLIAKNIARLRPEIINKKAMVISILFFILKSF